MAPFSCDGVPKSLVPPLTGHSDNLETFAGLLGILNQLNEKIVCAAAAEIIVTFVISNGCAAARLR
jgi:hypothetical protein